MSGAPSKRLHDDGGHNTPLKRPLEDTNIYAGFQGKLNQAANNDFHLPYELGQEGRLAKVQRTEHRDIDKRSFLVHRLPSSSNNPSLDHSFSPESRSELRNSKDSRDVKTENRESKAETRELYSDTRVDRQTSKSENEVKMEIGGGDEKEARADKGSQFTFKSDIKFEKDSHIASSSHSNWKGNRDYHRGKRYHDAANDGLDPWRTAWHSIQQSNEAPRDASRPDERDCLEVHEAVGENKVDLKEDRYRERDRKKKDDRHRDDVDRDKDRNERRSYLHMAGTSTDEHKDPLREETELEKWEREKKDSYREKEQIEKEKDHAKVEQSINEKERLQNEKELNNGKTTGQDNPASETTTIKDETRKAYDRDGKERKKESDVDVVDRSEQRGKYIDKEPDDGSVKGDAIAEKDREMFASAIQQRRRMSRSRGAPQAAQREPRFRSRVRDNEGVQGKTDAFAVVYKAGECVQELLKTWKEFEASQDGKTDQNLRTFPTLEIRIPAEYVSAANHQVRGGQLWGTDIYTDDSDLVAVLMHTGYCRPTSSPPPSAIQELQATVRVLPPQDCYTSTLRNNVRSRAWGAGIGCSYQVVRCCIVKKGGGTIDLEPRLNHTSAVEPTLAPVSVERTMTTRAAASNALRQQRFVREVTIQYNLCNEPWLKYSISAVADKGLKKPMFTSARLKKGEVLYLETHFNRYELCFTGEMAVCNGTASTSQQAPESEHEKLQNHNSHSSAGDRSLSDRDNIIDVFRWSRCKKPLPQNVLRSIGVPLPPEHLEVLAENLPWEDVQWSQAGVWVAGKEYVLARAHFLSPN